jgi:hypothetical protein
MVNGNIASLFHFVTLGSIIHTVKEIITWIIVIPACIFFVIMVWAVMTGRVSSSRRENRANDLLEARQAYNNKKLKKKKSRSN